MSSIIAPSSFRLAGRERVRQLAAVCGEHDVAVAGIVAAAVAVALGCAAVLGAAAWLPHEAGPVNTGSARVVLALVGLLLWLCLVGLGAAAWCTGAFDAVVAHRGVQAGVLVVAITALVVTSTRAADGAFSDAQTLPPHGAALSPVALPPG